MVRGRRLSLLLEGMGDLRVAWLWTDRELQEHSRQLQALVGACRGEGAGWRSRRLGGRGLDDLVEWVTSVGLDFDQPCGSSICCPLRIRRVTYTRTLSCRAGCL